MANKGETVIMSIPRARGAFLEVFEPKQVQGQGDPSYSAAIIIEPDAPVVAELDAAMLKAAVSKWGTNGKAILAQLVKTGRVGFRKAAQCDATGNPYMGFEDRYSISARARANQPPLVLERDKTPATSGSKNIYSGAWFNWRVGAWAQDNQYGKRVNFQLLGLQFVRDDTPFSGGVRVTADDFEDLADDEDVDIESLVG